MKNRIKALFMRHTALAVVLTMLLLAAGGAALAEFTLSHRAKRVVAAYGSGGVLFSSNILRASLVPYFRHVAEAVEGEIITVTVCNYAQGNKLESFPRDIPYTITATLVNSNMEPYTGSVTTSAAKVQMETWDEENDVSSLGDDFLQVGGSAHGILSSALADTHRFVVTFDKNMLITDSTPEAEQVFIKIEVTHGLDQQSGSGLPTTLSAYLGLVQRSEEAAARWTWSFDDARTRTEIVNGSTNSVPNSISDFSGFNYVIKGTGKTTLKLSWDSDFLILNDVSLREELGNPQVVSESGTWKSVTFEVNSADVINESTGVVEKAAKPRYAIQFFRNTTKTVGEIADWDALDSLVTCTELQSP